MKNMAWLSLVSERLRYTKVSQSSGLPADNSELMSRSKFTRDIGGGSANKDILGKNSERASEARSRFSSPRRTNEPRARGRKAAERKGPRGERGARSIADGGRRYRPSGFFGRPLLSTGKCQIELDRFPAPSVCETRAKKGHFFRARLGSCRHHTPPQLPQY